MLGFISLCFVSSANYIINDVIDLKRDRLNPEKKTRPIASGKLSIKKAALTAIILLVVGLTVAYSLNNIFFLIVLSLFLFTQVYST
ncbi:MAG: UbiA family prenyltransferase, partial [Methanobacteriota archaeon]